MDPISGHESVGLTVETFPKFLNLPKEIQLRIWRLAIWPRKLIVRCHKRLENGMYVRLHDPNSAPAVMHTCQDSRREGKTLYTRAFSLPPYQQYIWVNYDYDTIYICAGILDELDSAERNRIRYVIIDISSTESFLEIFVDKVVTMRSAEEIVLLADQGFRFWGMALGSIKDRFEWKFRDVEGWKCPTVKVVAKATGEEMTMRNYREIARVQRGRRIMRRGLPRRGGLGRGVPGS